ncbi:Maf family protein [Rhodovibrionaceae bacterium A322]
MTDTSALLPQFHLSGDPLPPLVLASGSQTRRQLLVQAGLSVVCDPPAVDEDEVKLGLKAAKATALQVAETLGELKAQRVSARHPGAFVIGGDQMLACEDQWFDKPKDLEEVKNHLRAFSGKTHTLETSLSVVRDGQRLWHHNTVARLQVRPLTEKFIEAYAQEVGEKALTSVGAYQLEGPGVQLFSRIDGDYFTILGLPLLPLLAFLRENGFLLK